MHDVAEDGVLSKKKSLHASEQERPDVVEKRAAWREKTSGIDLTRLIFIDESGAKTDMTRLYGRSFDGKRIVDSVPHSRWSTTTMISGIRLDGTTHPMVIKSATDGDVFQAFIDQVLGPTLKPGDIVIMDNLTPHKMAGVRKEIASRGAEVWYLPPYSPDMNPIEKMWSKIKAFLRKAKARTEEALEEAIGDALRRVTSTDANGWFSSCGYTHH
jgi:transposase